ncbi:unnamed protein product [Moneuplotes crassus]|uniref:Potassium channel domain-containing protein n=1 Tax=Euplotes crassus TaxID=5936 RepID=A0AAD1UIL2_EUPCR|nr:unnamed protein product [Moneuplotes crassus]
MLATTGLNRQSHDNRGPGGGSDRKNALGKMAASAFMSAGKNDNESDSEEESGNILDQRRINEIFVRLKVAEISSLNFAILGILCGIFDYEISYNDGSDEEKTFRIILECFCVFSTICIYIALIVRYTLVLTLQKSKGFYSKYDTLMNTGLYKYFFTEIVINSITPFPFIWDTTYSEKYSDYDTKVRYRVNDVFLLVMCLCRTYLIIRAILTLSNFMNTRSQRVCNMSGTTANFMFSVKSLMKKKPYSVLLTSLVVSVGLFGFVLRIFERPLSEASGQDFNSINNAFWVTLITMTTVGYGDFFPKSNIGRFIGILIAFWGVAFVSLFVVTLTNLLLFENGEEKSYILLQRLKSKDALKKEAVNVITAAYKKRRAAPGDISAIRNFRGYLLKFQAISRSIRGNYENETDADRIKRDLEDLREDIDFIKENLFQICKSIGIEEKDLIE